jgi:peroxiredoxin
MLPTDGGVPSGLGMTAAAGLGRGERAPDMVLPSRDGTPTRYYAHAGGRPALLVFADQACVARLDALAEGLTAIGDKALTVHVVGPPALASRHDLRFPLLQDPNGRAVGSLRGSLRRPLTEGYTARTRLTSEPSPVLPAKIRSEVIDGPGRRARVT